jgi:hypothetical protein
MMSVVFIILISIAMLVHIASVVGGVLVVRKHEEELKTLSLFDVFNTSNFCAHKLWFVILSILVSFGYLTFGAELFTRILSVSFNSPHILKYILMNLAVGVLICQYNFFILKKEKEE